MKNKKIVFLGLNGRGGTLHYASHITSYMVEYANTALFLPSYSKTNLISKKVKLIKAPAPPNLLKTLILTLNIKQHKKNIRAINKEHADIINILDIHPWYVLYWNYLKAKRKIVTINDPELHSGEAGLLMSFIIKKITRFLLKNADEIIVLGKKQEATIRRLGYKQKIHVSRIGHYAFFNRTKGTPKKTEEKTILFFGRIKEYKGLKYLLQALINLKKQKQEFKLMVAGDGDIKEYTKQINYLTGNIEIEQGYIPDEKVTEYFEKAAFIVMPYTDATQTGVIQITYSFKKTVIVTDVGSLPELVVEGKTGYIIKPKNTKELQEKIKFLLNNPEKTKQMGKDAHKFMQKELNWKIITKDLFNKLNK